MRSLRTAGVDDSCFDAVIAPLILNKLPYVTKRKFIDKTSNNDMTMDNLMQFLKKDVETSQRCDSLYSTQISHKTKQFTSKLEQDTYHSSHVSPNVYSTQSYHKQSNLSKSNSLNKIQSNNYSNNTESSFISYCAYCNKEHPSKSCTKYITIEERQTRLRELKLCNRCLKTGHFCKTCNRYCGYCKEMHHISLC